MKFKQMKFKQEKLVTFLILLFAIVIIILGTIKMFEGVERGSKALKHNVVDFFYCESNFDLTYKANKAPSYPQLEVLNGTAMEEYKPYIIEASEYYNIPVELYLGFANAESSFNRFRCNNPWGIDTGKGNDPRCYSSIKHSVNGFSQLIRYYYLDEGKDTAEKLVRKYVGYHNKDWVVNVQKYYR